MRTSIVLCFLFLTCGITAFSQDDVSGFTNAQLESAFRLSGLASQRLYSIQTFGSGDNGNPGYVAVLSSSRSGWHVWVFHRIQGGFKLEWSSGELPIEFSVSSPRNISLVDVGGESTVMFSGCAPHRCGGDYHGFLLYSTERNAAFFALLSQHEKEPRQITFSKNTLEAKNNAYRRALQSAVDEIIRRTDIR
jgi:hypothetical protein